MSGCQGLQGRREGAQAEHRDALGSEATPYANYHGGHTVLDISCKPTEWAAPRVDPDARCGLWGTTMCRCWFLNCNKHPTPVGMLIMGQAVGRGQGVDGKSLYIPLNFAVNLKLL